MNSEQRDSGRRGRFLAYAPLFLWIILILILGSSPGSMAQTSRFIKPLIEFFFPSAPPETFLLIHAAIRKSAHFVEYAILGLLASRAFLGPVSASARSTWAVRAIAVVIITASIDEINQSFLTTRTASAWDALLDLCGGLFGVLVMLGFRRRKPAVPNATRREP